MENVLSRKSDEEALVINGKPKIAEHQGYTIFGRLNLNQINYHNLVKFFRQDFTDKLRKGFQLC